MNTHYTKQDIENEKLADKIIYYSIKWRLLAKHNGDHT